MKSICVYLGANFGYHAFFREAAIALAHEIVKKNLTLIYGGSNVGLMGVLATTVKANGGKAIGVTTSHLSNIEIPLATLDFLHVLQTMQERKLWMQQNSDMFLVMPGGLGTLEEAIETWNAIKIGLFNKPIGFLNINGFFNNLFEFINTCADNGFISHQQTKTPKINSSPKFLLEELINQS